MNDLDRAIIATLRADAEEASVKTDTPQEYDKLAHRLDDADKARQRRRWVTGLVAVAAVGAIVALVIGVSRPAASPTPPAASPEPSFTSTDFAVPFTAELPAWTDTLSSTTSPTSESSAWVTWNRCPDGADECIGLSFNRYTTVSAVASLREPVTPASYVAYLRALDASGQILITSTEATTVDGRPATVLSITPKDDLPFGLGCHPDKSCDQFFRDVPGVYAVVDTGGLDPDGAVLVLWTRAGAIQAAEANWQDDFARTLETFRFVQNGS